MAQFQCPDCNALHDRPLSAGYVLAMRCEPCAFSAELDDARFMQFAFDVPLAA
jgi:hypothetical protein